MAKSVKMPQGKTSLPSKAVKNCSQKSGLGSKKK